MQEQAHAEAHIEEHSRELPPHGMHGTRTFGHTRANTSAHSRTQAHVAQSQHQVRLQESQLNTQ